MKKKLLMMAIGGLSFLVSTNGFAQAPVADFTINQQTTCVNSIVQLTDASSNSPTSWSYTVETQTGTLTAQNPTISFNAPGNFNVTLVAANASGSSAPLSKTVTVNDLPALTVSQPTAAVCAGDNVTFTASGASTYTWSNGVTNGASFSPVASGDFTVTATDANDCINSAVKSVTVNAVPSLTLAGVNFVCEGSSFTQTVSGADTYSWSTGVSGDNIMETPAASSNYTVSGTYTMTGCSSSLVKMITVDAFPTVTVTDGSVCSGSVYTISPSGAANYTYSSGTNTVTPLSNSSYTITGASPNGCTSTITAVANVTVNSLPTITVSGGTVCAGANYTITPGGVTTYTVSGGSAVVNPLTSQSYTVNGKDANGCAAALPAVADITVSAAPVVSVTAAAICAGDSYTIVASGANTYTYSGGSDIVTPASSAAYSVSGTDANGCVSLASAVANITVNALPTLTVSNGSICTGASFTITPTGASTYTFSNGSNVVTPSSNQSYSVTGTDANGCVTAAASVVNVTVNALPTLTVSGGAICTGASFTIVPAGASSYTYTGGSNVVNPTSNQTYSVTGTDANGCVTAAAAVVNVTVNALPAITVNSGAVCMGSSFTVVPAGAVTYTYSSGSAVVTPVTNQTITVTGTDANGCVSPSAQSAITVNALPVITVNSGSICMGSSFTLIPGGAMTYTYSSGSNIVSPVANQTVVIGGTDANGCISAVPATATITVNALPVITVNSGTVCAGSSFTLTANGAVTYAYPAGSSVVTPAATTSYSVTGTDANGCTSADAVSNVAVNALPSVSVTSASTVICIGESIVLTTSGADSFVWASGETTSTISLSPTALTVYSVTGTDAATGCANKVTITENATDCTGISELSANPEAGVYPNPNNGAFTVKVSQPTSVKVINMVGQTVYASDLAEGENAVSLNTEVSGIYFVQLKQGGQVKTVKVVKN